MRQFGGIFNGKLLPGLSGVNELPELRSFVEMGNPRCTYQIVELLPTPTALGLPEFNRRKKARLDELTAASNQKTMPAETNIPCDIVDGQCTTWAHKFRPDHQPTPEAKDAR
ncbi:hypothetical protein [Williamsia soli]|uniref:hypothetical protein n=1 Tax=Williamsia soli TaxID=364929 RepID=UPI001A9DD54B|nr:hypothetical protein [Williamsia soli]